MSKNNTNGFVNVLREFSLPLIFGVLTGLVVANVDAHLYHELVDYPLLGEEAKFLGHLITPHFLINDVFMVLFFGIATKEITESVLPGGALNPPSKAINPLLATLGGVLGPIVVFFVLTSLWVDNLGALLGAAPGTVDVGASIARAITPGATVPNDDPAVLFRGWGIPTATDIALAWLAARMVFGNGHPAVNFLLLLAVADDAIGLGIIAVFYPSPEHPPEPAYLGLVLIGMAAAYLLRLRNVRSWAPYVLFGGALSWCGLLMAHLHPALALVPIVPLIPGPRRDVGLFVAEQEAHVEVTHHVLSPLEEFEHTLKLPVDFGLFFFAFANAGVELGAINSITWVILASLLIGKTVGISLFSVAGSAAGFRLPDGMGVRHLMVAGLVAGLGLTVALFVAGEAYPGENLLQGPAKMGAVFSAVAGVIAFGLARVLGIRPATRA